MIIASPVLDAPVCLVAGDSIPSHQHTMVQLVLTAAVIHIHSLRIELEPIAGCIDGNTGDKDEYITKHGDEDHRSGVEL